MQVRAQTVLQQRLVAARAELTALHERVDVAHATARVTAAAHAEEVAALAERHRADVVHLSGTVWLGG